jgi:hypothetical protein
VPPRDAAALAPAVVTLRGAAAWTQPVRAASLDVALSALPRPDCTWALGLDAPIYFAVHSIGTELAPPGGAVVHALRYLRPDGRVSRSTRRELESVLDLVQPGWRDLRIREQWLPMATVAYDHPLAGRGGLAGRCPVVLAPGLFAAGDWVGAVGLLSDAAFASGRLAGEQAAMASSSVAAAAAMN